MYNKRNAPIFGFWLDFCGSLESDLLAQAPFLSSGW